MPPENPDNPIRNAAVAWVVRMHADTCTDEERQVFSDWLNASEEHQRVYERIETSWKGLDRFKGQAFSTRSQALSYRPVRVKKRLNRQRLAVAATLLLTIGFSTFSQYGWYGWPKYYTTEIGTRKRIKLADGTGMDMNSDTRVKVRSNRWQRDVEILRGEVFITVAPDVHRPFVVSAANGQITDIGTAFEVYLQPDIVQVAVQEGRVRIDAQQTQELSANQALAYKRDGTFTPVSLGSIAKLTAWREGQLVFNNRRLDEVLKELSRYSKTKVRMTNPAMGMLKVSGRFHIDKIDAALNSIAATLNISIQRPNAGMVVLGDG